MATSSPSSPSPHPSSPHFSSSSRKPVGNRRNLCRWTGCLQDDPFNTVQELVDHVNTKHVDPFQSEELVLCLWEGCKAYNVPCQKKQWLKQHMRRHTNERPHKCIMNGCNQSFWSAELLSHHLQLHLLPSPSPSLSKRKKTTTTTNSSETKSTLINEPIPGVQVSNGDTSIPSSACLEPPQPLAINGALIHTDPVDSITMSLIRKSVISQHMSASFAVEKRGSEEPVPIPVVTLKGKIIGKRTTFKKERQVEYLVTWCPRLVPDSWIPTTEYNEYRYIPINELLHCQKAFLFECNYLNKPLMASSMSTPSSSSLSQSSLCEAGSLTSTRKRKRKRE